MKKYTPYVLPLLVLGVVFLLVMRWYNAQTPTLPDSELFGEGVEIENLTDQEVQSFQGAGDFSTTDLQAPEGAENTENASGEVRYEVDDERVRFSIIAQLPETEGTYYVWLKELEGTAMRRAMTLEPGKGGYVGSAAISSELLPFEVIVSDQADANAARENYVLRSVIE